MRTLPARTVDTDKDAYVDAGSPDTNFGGSLSLYVRWQDELAGGNDRRTLVGFDMSSLFDDPDVLDVLEATLRIEPSAADDGQALDAHEIDESAWTEGSLTWNNQPAAGELQDTETSSDAPHEWDVLAAVKAAFDDAGQSRVGFLLLMQAGGSGETNTVEYDSRETILLGASIDLKTREQRRADLDSQTTVNTSGTGTLDSFVETKFRGGRWRHWEKSKFLDGTGSTFDLAGLAWDPSLDRFWTAELFAGGIVHRHTRDGSHDVTFDVVEDASPIDGDVHAVAVGDEGTVFAGMAPSGGEVGDVLECSVDENNTELVVQTRHTAHEANPAWITHDGENIWILEFAGGKVEERDPSDWSLGRSGSIGNGDSYRGIARASVHPHLVLWNDAVGRLEQQHPDELGILQDSRDWDSVISQGEGIAFLDRTWKGTMFVGESGSHSECWAFSPRQIESQVLVTDISEADIASQVQPSTIPGHADLDSQVATGAEADLPSQATPRVPGSADLESSVQPASLEGLADLTAILEVDAVPIAGDHQARAQGRVSPAVVVDEDDVADLGGEIGSPVTLNPEGEARDLRRVVHLLDGEESYPRARADTATTLHRGDAVLYAQSGDELEVGDVLEWQDKRWKVVGLLGWETIGDSRLYQEIGLRGLATVHEARAIGTVS